MRNVLFVLLIAALTGGEAVVYSYSGNRRQRDAARYVVVRAFGKTDWYCYATYNWTAFVRPPTYPLWLALVHSAGIRQGSRWVGRVCAPFRFRF